MAAVHDQADETGSISSVPASTIGTDIDEDEMPQAVTAPVNPDTGASAKDREAQAETSRSRQRAVSSQPQQSRAQDPPESSTSHQPEPVQDTVVDPDDVPPPSYAEAVQRQSRPDDAVRHAWRQGITQGSLDMDSFSRLVSPTSENQASQLPRTSEVANHNQAQTHSPQAQRSPVDEYTPVANQADATANPHYGSTPFAHRPEPERIADEEAGPHDDSSSDSDHSRRGRRWWWRRKREDRFGRLLGGAGRGGPGSDRGQHGQRSGGRRGRRSRDPPRWSADYEKRRRRRLKKLLFWLLVIAVLVTIVNFLIEAVRSNWTDDNGGSDGDLPGTIPSQPTQPTQPTDPGKVTPGRPKQHRQSVCQAAQWTNYFTYSYDKVDDLHIKEALTQYDVGGLMRVIAAPEDQERTIEASVAFAVAPRYSVNAVHFTTESSGLSLDEPEITPNPYERNDLPCVDVDIVLSIKPNAEIANLRLETWHLSIVIGKDVFGNSTRPGLHVSKSTALLTIGGRVTAEPLSSRSTIIRTKSGSVNGHYSLYDLLDIETASGSVTVGVDPREADKDDPTHPAKLRVSTRSGSVRVDTSLIGSLPNRNYQTLVDTASASIAGSYLLGSEAEFHTHSGTTDVKLLPYIFSTSSGLRQPDSPTPPTPPSPPSSPTEPSPPSQPEKLNVLRGFPPLPDLPELPEIPDIPKIPKIPEIPKIPDPPVYPTLPDNPSDGNHNDSPHSPHEHAFSQTLVTSTSSSTTRVRILSPYSSNNQDLLLSASHSTNSGTMHLSYPDEWSGNIEAETMSGHLNVKGSRLVRTGGSWNWGDWRSRYGQKGKWERHDRKGNVGQSKIEAGSMSSTIEITFDEF